MAKFFFLGLLIFFVGCSEDVLDSQILNDKPLSESSLLSREASKGKNFLSDGSVYEGELAWTPSWPWKKEI